MVIAFVADRGSNTSAAAGSTFGVTMAAGASITPGNTLIASIAFRDVATPPTDPDSVPGNAMAIDTRGNLWRRVGYAVNAGATTAADDGAVVHIWVCSVVFPYSNGDTITWRAPIGSRPMTHVAGNIQEFSGVARISRAFDFDSATGNTAASSVTGIAPAAVGRLVFGAVAVATNPTLTGDGDATDGVWSAISQDASAGIRRGSQYKIVTGTGAQTWDVTWTGAQRWAAAAVVMDASSASVWPLNADRLANPNFGCPAGPEILPTSRTQTPIDTGTAYLFDANIPPESLGSSSIYWDGFIELAADNVDVQHRVAVDIYERGAELSRNEPFIFTLGTPNFAVPQNGTETTAGGTSSADLVAALAGSGGEQVVLVDPGTPDVNSPSSIDLYWDASALAALQDTHRILNVRLSYVAWKDDAAAAEPGEGMAVFWRDELAFSSGATSRPTSLYGAWLVNDYRTAAGRVYRNLGEVCGLPRLGANIGEQYGNVQACWTIRDLLHMNTGDRSCMFSFYALNGSHPSQETIFLDTVRLDVFLVPETRIAQGVRRICSGVGFPGSATDGDWTGEKIMPLYAATNTGQYWQAPATPTPITVAVREPVVPSGSDWYSAQTDPDILNNDTLRNARYSTQEAVGPSVVMRSITQPRETLDPQVSVRRVEWSNGQIAENADPEPFGSMIQSISLIDLNSYSGFWPYYLTDNFVPDTVRTGNSITQQVRVDGAHEYDTVKLLVKPNDLTIGQLNVSVEQPLATVLATASLTVADCLALPDVGNGYREVRLQLSNTIAPSGTSNVHIVLTSTNNANAGWIIGEALDGTGRFNYQAVPNAVPSTFEDYAVVLCCTMEDPDVDVSSRTITIPATSDKCLATSMSIPCLTINNATEYDYIGISRVVGVDVTPITVLAGTAPEEVVLDTFSRGVVNGWGTADTGQSWVDTGTAYSVASNQGRMTLSAASTAAIIRLDGPSIADQEVVVQAGPSALSTGGTQEVGVMLRYVDANNFYVLRALFGTAGSITLRIYRMLGGVLTLLDTYTYELSHLVAGRLYTMKFQAVGEVLRGKIWDPTLSDEPAWQSVASDSNLTTGVAGAWGARGAGNTNVGQPLLYDNFTVDDLDVPLTWCDYGVPWDLIAGSIEYAVTGYREADRAELTTLTSAWAGSSVAPGAAFGLAGEDFLVAYVPVSDGGELQVTWNPLNPIESMPLAGKNYQVALRASEERGLGITVTVIADHLLRCETVDDSITYDESGFVYDEEGYTYDGETSAEGFSDRAPGRKSLSPTPYALIRSLESYNRLTLKIPGGHTRYVTADVGALVTTPAFGIYLAELTLTDTTVPSTDPYSAPGGEPVL